MKTSRQLVSDMILDIDGVLYKVLSCMKVSDPRSVSFMKVSLQNLSTGKKVEKKFKLGQSIKEVSPQKHFLEFLYFKDKSSVFMDMDYLDLITIPFDVLHDKLSYLKKGVQLEVLLYDNVVVSAELPQFMELMVADEGDVDNATSTKIVFLETGAKIRVPLFIEVNDIVKIDPRTNEFIQRV